MRRYLMLIPLACILTGCGTVDAFRDRSSDVMANINERVLFGFGWTRASDGWHYIGLKLKARAGAGSDSVEEREREVEILSHPSSK